MSDRCPLSQKQICPNWIDYEVTKCELEEADELCQLNWQEIQKLKNYISELQFILSTNEIAYPEL